MPNDPTKSKNPAKASWIQFVLGWSLCLANTFFCYSQAYVVEQQETLDLTTLNQKLVYLYEDTTAQLTFEKISQPEWSSSYIPLSKDIEYDRRSVLWMRFSIKNPSAKLQQLVLYLNDWDVSIWSKTGEHTSFLGQQGILAPPFKRQDYLGNTAFSGILTGIPPGQTVTYYVRTPGYLQNYALFVGIQSDRPLAGKIIDDLVILGIYTGSFVIAMLANLFLLVQSPKWRNVFYALNCTSYFIFFTGYFRIGYFLPIELPVTHTFFLPLAVIFYLLFVFSYLGLESRHRSLGNIFKGYSIALSIVALLLLYFYIIKSHNYYLLLVKVNQANFFFTLFSIVAVARVTGRQKYFIVAGLFFLFCGYGIHGYTLSLGVPYISFIYPMTGSVLEMISFLLGNFFLLIEERKQVLHQLSKKENELEKKTEQLYQVTSEANEKNRLIREFEKRTHDVPRKDQELEYIRQLTQSSILTDKDWVRFKTTFEEVHKNFFVKLKSKQPGLTESEIRLAALTKLNLSTKEMANMLGISTDSIHKSRYRLRKKLLGYGKHSLEELVGVDNE